MNWDGGETKTMHTGDELGWRRNENNAHWI
jgi:hypothetical protein